MNGHKRKSKKTRNLQEKSSIPPRRDPCLFKVALPRIFSLRIFFCSLISFPFCFVFCLKKKKIFFLVVCVYAHAAIFPKRWNERRWNAGQWEKGKKETTQRSKHEMGEKAFFGTNRKPLRAGL